MGWHVDSLQNVQHARATLVWSPLILTVSISTTCSFQLLTRVVSSFSHERRYFAIVAACVLDTPKRAPSYFALKILWAW